MKWLICNHSFISNYIFGTENIVTRDINIELLINEFETSNGKKGYLYFYIINYLFFPYVLGLMFVNSYVFPVYQDVGFACK